MASSQLKCVCHGYNPECNFCYGSGYVSETDNAPRSVPIVTPRPVKIDLSRSPSRQQSKTKLLTKSGKLSLEEAVLRQGRVGADLERSKRLVRYLNILDVRLKAGDEQASLHYAELRRKLAKTLRLERTAYVAFLMALLNSTTTDDRQANSRVNVTLSTSDVRFTPQEIDLLRAAREATLPKKVLLDQERKLYEDHKANLTSPPTRDTPRQIRRTPPTINNLLIIAPAGSLNGQGIEAVIKRVGKDINHIYISGSKRSFREFKAAFPAANCILVENPINAEMIRQSPSTSTLDLTKIV